MLLRGFCAAQTESLLRDLAGVTAAAPFRHMITPGGYRMSVAHDQLRSAGLGLRRIGLPVQWNRSPHRRTMARDARRLRRASRKRQPQTAGFPAFAPDACLVNRYEPGAKLSLHQDKDERDFRAPIVSVSLGLPATFLFGGQRRKDPVRRFRLVTGDVVVWGGPARLTYHGVSPLADGEDPLTGRYRINLTFRKAG